MLQVRIESEEQLYFSPWRLRRSSNRSEFSEDFESSNATARLRAAKNLWDARSAVTCSANDLRAAIERAFAEIKEVAAITVSERDKSGHRVMEVWIALSQNSQPIRDRVYEAEDKFMDALPERYIEFHVFQATHARPFQQVHTSAI